VLLDARPGARQAEPASAILIRRGVIEPDTAGGKVAEQVVSEAEVNCYAPAGSVTPREHVAARARLVEIPDHADYPAGSWAGRLKVSGLGPGSRRRVRRPHAACARFEQAPASATQYPYCGRPPG